MKELLSRRLRFLPTVIACAITHIASAVTFSVSPTTVSNTYSGNISLQVTGLANGDQVVVQKFVDANGNGVVDAGDVLWQQFFMKDGKASVFFDGTTAVTNLNLPNDLDGSVNGQINASRNFPGAGFEQTIVAKYLYVLSSPVGNFPAITNAFTVTNFPYAQTIAGSVIANGTNVPNAAVLLFAPSGQNLNPMGGVIADNSGNYTLHAATGNYILVAFKSGFVANLSTTAQISLGTGATINTNLSLTSADRTISGSVTDAGNFTGLGGMMMPLESKNGLLTVAFTDTNGNFSAPVTSDQWKLDIPDASGSARGYLRLQNKVRVDATTGSVSSVSIALPKANALFYGSIKDGANQPFANLSLFSEDGNTYQWEQNVTSDANGNYFAGALSGSPWQVQISLDSAPTNYVFSSPDFDMNMTGGTNMNAGQAVRADFTALLATNHITGHVQQSNGSPIGTVQIRAMAVINNATFQAQTDTDSSGNYSLNVANGYWDVSVGCQGGNDSLDAILGNGNYLCPSDQNVGITNNNGAANFTVYPCNGQILIFSTSPLPDGTVSNYYSYTFSGGSCGGGLNWSLNSGTLPGGLTLYSGGALNGTPTNSGTFNFSVQASDGSHSTNVNFSVTINGPAAPPPQIDLWHLDEGTGTVALDSVGSYNGSLQNSPQWVSGVHGSALKFNGANQYVFLKSGPFFGAGAGYGPANFTIEAWVNWSGGGSSGQQQIYCEGVGPFGNDVVDLLLNNGVPSFTVLSTLWLTVSAPSALPANEWHHLAAVLQSGVGGILYVDGRAVATNASMTAAQQSPNETDLGRFCGGGGSRYFSGIIDEVQLFNLVRTPAQISADYQLYKPMMISAPAHFPNGQFQMSISGASNQNYTVQMSTNLASTNWISVLVTNVPSGSFQFSDTNATNAARFYRVLPTP